MLFPTEGVAREHLGGIGRSTFDLIGDVFVSTRFQPVFSVLGEFFRFAIAHGKLTERNLQPIFRDQCCLKGDVVRDANGIGDNQVKPFDGQYLVVCFVLHCELAKLVLKMGACKGLEKLFRVYELGDFGEKIDCLLFMAEIGFKKDFTGGAVDEQQSIECEFFFGSKGGDDVHRGLAETERC